MERAEEEAKKRRKEERKRLARQRKEERAQRRRMKAFRKRQKGGTGSFVRHAAPPSDTHGDNGDSDDGDDDGGEGDHDGSDEDGDHTSDSEESGDGEDDGSDSDAAGSEVDSKPEPEPVVTTVTAAEGKATSNEQDGTASPVAEATSHDASLNQTQQEEVPTATTPRRNVPRPKSSRRTSERPRSARPKRPGSASQRAVPQHENIWGDGDHSRPTTQSQPRRRPSTGGAAGSTSRKTPKRPGSRPHAANPLPRTSSSKPSVTKPVEPSFMRRHKQLDADKAAEIERLRKQMREKWQSRVVPQTSPRGVARTLQERHKKQQALRTSSSRLALGGVPASVDAGDVQELWKQHSEARRQYDQLTGAEAQAQRVNQLANQLQRRSAAGRSPTRQSDGSPLSRAADAAPASRAQSTVAEMEARLDAELRVQRQAAAELALESEQLAAELAELQATREAEVAAKRAAQLGATSDGGSEDGGTAPSDAEEAAQREPTAEELRDLAAQRYERDQAILHSASKAALELEQAANAVAAEVRRKEELSLAQLPNHGGRAGTAGSRASAPSPFGYVPSPGFDNNAPTVLTARGSGARSPSPSPHQLVSPPPAVEVEEEIASPPLDVQVQVADGGVQGDTGSGGGGDPVDAMSPRQPRTPVAPRKVVVASLANASSPSRRVVRAPVSEPTISGLLMSLGGSDMWSAPALDGDHKSVSSGGYGDDEQVVPYDEADSDGGLSPPVGDGGGVPGANPAAQEAAPASPSKTVLSARSGQSAASSAALSVGDVGTVLSTDTPALRHAPSMGGAPTTAAARARQALQQTVPVRVAPSIEASPDRQGGRRRARNQPTPPSRRHAEPTAPPASSGGGSMPPAVPAHTPSPAMDPVQATVHRAVAARAAQPRVPSAGSRRSSIPRSPRRQHFQTVHMEAGAAPLPPAAGLDSAPPRRGVRGNALPTLGSTHRRRPGHHAEEPERARGVQRDPSSRPPQPTAAEVAAAARRAEQEAARANMSEARRFALEAQERAEREAEEREIAEAQARLAALEHAKAVREQKARERAETYGTAKRVRSSRKLADKGDNGKSDAAYAKGGRPKFSGIDRTTLRTVEDPLLLSKKSRRRMTRGDSKRAGRGGSRAKRGLSSKDVMKYGALGLCCACRTFVSRSRVTVLAVLPPRTRRQLCVQRGKWATRPHLQQH